MQRDLLRAFFERTQRFFLTGGAALAGFYFGHRRTKDLDLFAAPGVELREGAVALMAAASSVGATMTVLRESADFMRYMSARGDDQTLVDLVIDRAPQVADEKPPFGVVRVDSLREIAANKLCALLDRVEGRDLVDLRELLSAGLSLEDMLRDAQRKHAGADPATLAWVLGGWRLPPSAALPEGATIESVDEFREELVRRLARLALPDEP
ncbi:MAG: nucleotidyl transferase AbiEii/AbiGii toxin family protein [Polyangiales bacterium]